MRDREKGIWMKERRKRKGEGEGGCGGKRGRRGGGEKREE